MSILPNAGILPPIPDTFDFEAWRKIPQVMDPTGQSLRVRNAFNCQVEVHNEASADQTLNCRDDRVAHPDVGPQMQAYYGYAEDDILQMVASQALCTSVGPLPVFILQRVELMRAAKADALEAGKEKSKAKPIQGSLVLHNPIMRVTGQQPDTMIPLVLLRDLNDSNPGQIRDPSHEYPWPKPLIRDPYVIRPATITDQDESDRRDRRAGRVLE
ncbi:hypothetical protein BDZ89DRAFT_1159011 [Hymenopellis radicata]|nr:hypothetical protein BDZ89DRAFT_1159011 [Hymenopellis radicata]